MAGVRTKTLIDLRNRCQAALDSGESIKGNPDFARARKVLNMPPNNKGRQSVVRELDAAIAYRGVTPVTIAPKRSCRISSVDQSDLLVNTVSCLRCVIEDMVGSDDGLKPSKVCIVLSREQSR